MPRATGICRRPAAQGPRRNNRARRARSGLPPGVPDRVARVAHLQAGERLDVGVHRVGEPAQQPGPVPGRDAAPGREGAVGALDPRVHLGAAGEAHGFHDRLVDRADHVKGSSGHDTQLNRAGAG